MTAADEVARTYRTFARREAAGRSPLYETLAEAVARDPALSWFVASLPPGKRQPGLLFAASRYLLGSPPAAGELLELVLTRPAELTEIMLGRRVQTNEPARCAVLLPALAGLAPPLALIEAGASAGLTLLFDRYSYDYGGHRIAGDDPLAPTLRCEPRGPVPLPARVPEISWRAGLDLNPLDVTSDEDVRWLSCLVWPGESDRAERLESAIAAARRDPPVVRRGDLVTDLPALAAEAPRDATLVVTHCSVLYQVAAPGRARFAGVVRDLGARWLFSESPGILPGLSAPAVDDQMCVVACDGEAVARADSHGSWLEWYSAPRTPR